MNLFARKTIFVVLTCVTSLAAAAWAQIAVQPAKPAGPSRAAFYVDLSVLHLGALIPPPPAPGSPQLAGDLAELHRIEQARTPEQVTAAKADEDEEDVFVYKSVLGPGFNSGSVPLTAELGAHVKNEQGVAGSELKALFARARPYQFDKTLHPVCGLTELPNSYPSGHALTGYLEAFTVAEMVPEKRSEILARADAYAHNRLVCGVHYPSDVEASRRVAYVVFGYMLATPRFERDLAAARAELRSALGLK